MKEETPFLKQEDYVEPCCPFKRKKTGEHIPVKRIFEKEDVLLCHEKYDEAERLIKNWIREAEDIGDSQGKLTMLNEAIGFYRKQNIKDECIHSIECAKELLLELNLGESIIEATSYINIATGYKAFGYIDEAYSFYEKAKILYEKLLPPQDSRLAALYNNMAITLMAIKHFDDAFTLYNKALSILEKNKDSYAEMAVTYLNLADYIVARYGVGEKTIEVQNYLHLAEEVLDMDNINQDGEYAYLCEKCAFVFDEYGYSDISEKLRKRGREIRERS